MDVDINPEEEMNVLFSIPDIEGCFEGGRR